MRRVQFLRLFAGQRGEAYVRFLTALASAASVLCLPLSAPAAIPQQERDALIAMFNAMGGSAWATKTGWLGPPESECSWYGVTCEATQSSVVGLHLAENGLYGGIPSDLVNLPNLEVLELDGNRLEGRIPPTLGNLQKLKVLNLSKNELSGTIPMELGNLKQLQSLKLRFAQSVYLQGLTGSIPRELGNLTNLQTLELDANQLSGPIPAELGKLTGLRILHLQNNRLSGIPAELGNLTSLQELDLGDNPLSGGIPTELGNLVNLQKLFLTGTLLSGPIPPELGKLKNLQEFWLGATELSGAIPPELGSLANLRILYLNHTHLSGSIPPQLGSLTNLEVLDLGSNQLTGRIPAELGRLSSVQKFYLNYNQLSGPLPAAIGNLEKLQELQAARNQLSGSIPPELGNLANLASLDLSENQLSGAIPPELGKLRNLGDLRMAANRLSGAIPPELADAITLFALDLAYNQLTGAIPFQLGNLPNLGYLALTANQLNGTIPAELRNLTKLKNLQLGYNQLSGDVPPWLETLTNLRALDLSYNHLDGPIPVELGSLTGLDQLSLGGNRLSGNVPAWLGNLSKLNELHLEANRLSGPLPLSLNDITTDRFYSWDFSYNALYDTNGAVNRFKDASTQTVAPRNIAAAVQPDSSILITWLPIAYVADGGRYEVYQSTRNGKMLAGSTASKAASSIMLAGLGPGTYHFVVRTVTDPHKLSGGLSRFQQNTVTSEFSAELSVAVGTPSIDISLSSGGAESASTVGGQGETNSGYAVVDLNSGAAPYGTAVFSLKQNGVLVSEAAVPASPPTTRALMFVDYRTGTTIPGATGAVDVYTGLAAVNSGTAPAIITFTLRNLRGESIAAGTGTLNEGAHIAVYLHQLPEILSGFVLPASFPVSTRFGTLELSSSQPLSVVALRLTSNQRGETLLTSTPVADLARPAATTPIYFTQVADGGGYTTSLLLLNTTSAPESGTLRLFSNDGSSFAVQQVGGISGSSFPYSITPGGAYVFQTDASPQVAQVGWAELTPQAGTQIPAGQALFQYSPSGILVTETGVSSAIPTTHARIFVDTSGGHDTGLALGNPGTIPTIVSLTAFQLNGATRAGTSRGPVNINGNGHDAAFVSQQISDLPQDFQGVLDIVSDSPFVALTLRSLVNERGDFLLTTFPVADLNQPASSPVIFPQIADGGGYTTQIILLSPRGSSSTTLRFFDNTGVPLPVGKGK